MSDQEFDDSSVGHEEVENGTDEKKSSSSKSSTSKRDSKSSKKKPVKEKESPKSKKRKAVIEEEEEEEETPAGPVEDGADEDGEEEEEEEESFTPAKKQKSSTPSSSSIPSFDSKDPVSVVRQYMRDQNRPYSIIMLHQNLHAFISKSSLTKILEQLVVDGQLQYKDFKKTRLYMAKQDETAIDPAQVQQLEQQVQELNQKHKNVAEQVAKLQRELNVLTSQPTDEELSKKLSEMEKKNTDSTKRLNDLKNDKKRMTKDQIYAVQKKYNDSFKEWKKRRRACLDLIDMMCGDEGDPKKIIKHVGIETDEDEGLDIKKYADLVREVAPVKK